MDLPQTIDEARRAMLAGSLAPVELVAACLARIDRLEPRVSAWAHLDAEAALQAARQLPPPAQLATRDMPLYGIPVGAKDIVDVAGMPTRAGSTLTAEHAAAADAPTVARLRAAGAILLGKTVTTEFACFDPPPTINPWNAACTPGGSSSGSAAAVALGMCLAAIGSQTGGSITRPASYCGVSGLKPTFGAVSRRGVVPVSFHLDHVGVLARQAADCARVAQVMYGADPNDPGSRRAPADFFWPASPARPRLGVMRSYFFDTAEPEPAALGEAALAELAAQGAALVDVPLPEGFDAVHAMHHRIMYAEGAEYHRRTFGAPRAGYGPKMAAFIDEGLNVSAEALGEARAHQQAFQAAAARTLAEVDAVVTLATPAPAPADLSTTGDPRFNAPWSYAGVPTVSFPCALSSGGMPIALQLVGPPWSDGRVAAVAAWCQQRLGFDKRPPESRPPE